MDHVSARQKLIPKEKHVEALCDQLMAMYGYAVIRFSQPRHSMQTAGIPDRKYFGATHKDGVWFECKRPGGKQSDAQRTFQLLAEYCGETYVLGGVDDLGTYLRSLPRPTHE